MRTLNKKVLQELIIQHITNLKNWLGTNTEYFVIIRHKIRYNLPLVYTDYKNLNTEYLSRLIENSKDNIKELHDYDDLKKQSKGKLNKVYLDNLAVCSQFIDKAVNDTRYSHLFGADPYSQLQVSLFVVGILALVLLTYYNGVVDFDEETMANFLPIFNKFAKFLETQDDLKGHVDNVLKVASNSLYSLIVCIDGQKQTVH